MGDVGVRHGCEERAIPECVSRRDLDGPGDGQSSAVEKRSVERIVAIKSRSGVHPHVISDCCSFLFGRVYESYRKPRGLSNMDTLKSIRTFDDDKIDIINQLLLPHTVQYIQVQSTEQAYDAIKSMKVGRLADPQRNSSAHRSAVHPPLERLHRSQSQHLSLQPYRSHHAPTS